MLHLFMAEGFEEIEALTTLDILRRCGLQVATVSITGTRLIRGAHGIPIMVDTVFRRGSWKVPKESFFQGECWVQKIFLSTMAYANF